MQRSAYLKKNDERTELTMASLSPFCYSVFAFKQFIVSPGF